MSERLRTETFTELRDYIETRCGIALGEDKEYLIETRLSKLMNNEGYTDFEEFSKHLRNELDSQLDEKIIDAMTTNETLWFRDKHPYTILKNVLLPALAKELLAGRRQKVRIWSAAASTGQEPYSIAMTVFDFCQETPGLNKKCFEILATDISTSALALAQNARYDALAMGRGLPNEYRQRFFTSQDREWVLSDDIKSMVQFKPFNLQHSPTSLGNFDIVFARYVAIYFSPEFKKLFFANIAEALNEPGTLFIGAVESLLGVTDEFDRVSADNGYYYVL